MSLSASLMCVGLVKNCTLNCIRGGTWRWLAMSEDAEESGQEEEVDWAGLGMLCGAHDEVAPIRVPPAAVAAPRTVKKESQRLSNADFVRKYRLTCPVVCKGIVDQWPAYHKLKGLSDLRNEGDGQEEVLLLSAHDDVHFMKNDICEQHKMTLAEAVAHLAMRESNAFVLCDGVQGSRVYMRAPVTVFGAPEQHFPPPYDMINGDPEQRGRTAMESGNSPPRWRNAVVKHALCGVWVSNAGCITPLHFDLCHGMLCQVFGSKKVTLFHPDDTPNLYRHTCVTSNPHSSRVHIERWNVDAEYRSLFPRVAEATRYEVDLNAGEMLYIPPFWWHHVETTRTSASVLLPFDMDPREPVHYCSAL